MVQLRIKRGDQNLFWYEGSVNDAVVDCYEAVIAIYNGRLKISRICDEMDQLKLYGTMYPPNMLGLTEEQIADQKLTDEWGEKCVPKGQWKLNIDPVGRRNGKQADENMQNVISKAVNEARTFISEKQFLAGVFMSLEKIQDTLDMLKEAVKIVYPMNLPPHDPIRQELENCEDLTGMQASSEVIDVALAQLWFSNKLLERDKKLSHYLGVHEKTRVTLQLTKSGGGPPPRGQVISEEEKKLMMLHAYKRQEELKKLEQDDDDVYLDSSWADSTTLKKSFQGVGEIKWKMGE